MKRQALISGMVLLLGVLAVLAGLYRRGDAADSPNKPVANGPEWEYLIVSGGSSNLSAEGNDKYPRMRKAPDRGFSRENFPLERNLDKLGAEGWELVAVTGSPADPVFYLKRPKQ
ncbi:MAG TPA: hypothetical protein VNO70_05565 [Blastocatellia bacterium]|nr:hypothetical protein [Blastocatellia bacterium]